MGAAERTNTLLQDFSRSTDRSVERLLGRSWVLLECCWGSLGSSLGLLGGLLGPLGVLVGASWVILEASWAGLGVAWSLEGALGEPKGASRKKKATFHERDLFWAFSRKHLPPLSLMKREVPSQILLGQQIASETAYYRSEISTGAFRKCKKDTVTK